MRVARAIAICYASCRRKLGALSRALGVRLLRHRPQVRPCHDTKIVSRHQTTKPCRDREHFVAIENTRSRQTLVFPEAPLLRHQGSCHDTKSSNDATPLSRHQNWVVTPKAPADQHPVETLILCRGIGWAISVTTGNSLSR